jgi:2-octaprenyl-6-methoxyphenol hydroxylase
VTNILVIGAGPVGATFALLAKRRGLNVSLIDARIGASRETRSLALSYGSKIQLERAGAWPRLASSFGTPTEIHRVHTSQRGGFGRVLISREDAGVPALGYVVGYAALQDALDRAIQEANVPCRFGVTVTDIQQGNATTGASVTFIENGQAASSQTLHANVIVMADGGANLAKLDGVAIHEKDYGQSAMLAYVMAEKPHGCLAFERFTPEGPLALLPYDGPNKYAMVWIDSHDAIETMIAQSEAETLAAFQEKFGTRAGKLVSLANRRSYPLRLRQTATRVAGAVAIIGNAAQAMHPVAGQGFNLGLRDAAAFANLLADTDSVASALIQYANVRDQDVSRGVGFTDLLATSFLSDNAALRIPRGLALAAVDGLPFARRALTNRMLFGAGR